MRPGAAQQGARAGRAGSAGLRAAERARTENSRGRRGRGKALYYLFRSPPPLLNQSTRPATEASALSLPYAPPPCCAPRAAPPSRAAALAGRGASWTARTSTGSAAWPASSAPSATTPSSAATRRPTRGCAACYSVSAPCLPACLLAAPYCVSTARLPACLLACSWQWTGLEKQQAVFGRLRRIRPAASGACAGCGAGRDVSRAWVELAACEAGSRRSVGGGRCRGAVTGGSEPRRSWGGGASGGYGACPGPLRGLAAAPKKLATYLQAPRSQQSCAPLSSSLPFLPFPLHSRPHFLLPTSSGLSRLCMPCPRCPQVRTYADVMRQQQLERERDNTLRNIAGGDSLKSAALLPL